MALSCLLPWSLLSVPHRLHGLPPSTLSPLLACFTTPDAHVPAGKTTGLVGLSVSFVQRPLYVHLDALGLTGPDVSFYQKQLL